jgi:site-specific recombinase XerD
MNNIEDFKRFLYSNKLKESTVEGHVQDVKRFESWCTIENIQVNKTTYNQALNYIDYLHVQRVTKAVINNYLHSLRKYFDYLLLTNQSITNPFKKLRIRNIFKKFIDNDLSTEELDEIYLNYQNKAVWMFKNQTSTESHRRNVAILGILIYQGVQTTELQNIERQHVNFKESIIFIPSTARTNARTLKLNAYQLLHLQTYMKQLPDNQCFLFIGDIPQKINYLLKILAIQNLTTNKIRSNVIMNWLKINNIRQVQYLAGHRYISSTERYQRSDIRDLQTALELFHPMQS